MRTGLYTEKVVLSGSTDPQAFFVPPKCRIDGIIFEKRGTQAGNIHMGTEYSFPTKESAVLNNISAAVAGGEITVTLQGETEEVSAVITIQGGKTASEVATLIAAAEYAGWTAAVEESAGPVYNVVFTPTTAFGNLTVGTYSIDTGGTGIATGQPSVFVDGEDTVAAVQETATLAITAAPTSVGVVTVAGEEVALDTATEVDAVTTAAAIAAFSFTDWDAAQGADVGVDDHIVYFSAKVAGAIDDITFVDTGTTGTTANVSVVQQGVDEIAAIEEVVHLPLPTAPTSDGEIVLTIGNTTIEVDVFDDDSAVEVATSIINTFNAASTEFIATSDETNIIFTAVGGGVKEGNYAVAYSTGVTTEGFTTTEGAGWIVTDDVVESVALPTTHMEMKQLTVKKAVFSVTKKTPIIVKVDQENCLGTLYVSYEKFAK